MAALNDPFRQTFDRKSSSCPSGTLATSYGWEEIDADRGERDRTKGYMNKGYWVLPNVTEDGVVILFSLKSQRKTPLL